MPRPQFIDSSPSQSFFGIVSVVDASVGPPIGSYVGVVASASTSTIVGASSGVSTASSWSVYLNEGPNSGIVAIVSWGIEYSYWEMFSRSMWLWLLTRGIQSLYWIWVEVVMALVRNSTILPCLHLSFVLSLRVLKPGVGDHKVSILSSPTHLRSVGCGLLEGWLLPITSSFSLCPSCSW